MRYSRILLSRIQGGVTNITARTSVGIPLVNYLNDSRGDPKNLQQLILSQFSSSGEFDSQLGEFGVNDILLQLRTRCSYPAESSPTNYLPKLHIDGTAVHISSCKV